MWRRLKTLVLMQLSERLDLSFMQNKGRMWARFAMSFGLLVVVIILADKALNYVFGSFLVIAFNENLLLSILFFTQIISIIACTKGLVHTLYLSRDNSLLLSLPAKHSEIFVSKLIVFYIYEVLKNIFLLLPIFFGYALGKTKTFDINFAYYIKVLIFTVIIPFFPVFIGALISIPLVFVINFLKKKRIANILVSGSLTMGIFWLINMVVKFITQKDNLRLVSLRKIISDGINIHVVPVFNRFALIYQNIIKVLFNRHSFSQLAINGLIIVGVLVVLTILIFVVSMPVYFKLANHSFEAVTKKKYSASPKPNSNIFMTFFKKELRVMARSDNQLIANIIYLLLLPFLIYIVNLIFLSLKMSIFGFRIALGMNLLIGLMLLMSGNIMSATALSREGSEFYLLKTVPAHLQNIAWAKLTINIIISTIFIIVACFALYFTHVYPLSSIFGLGIIYFFVNTAHIFWSFELDLMNPKFKEFAGNQAIDDNPNATKSIIIGAALAIIFAGLLIFFIFENQVLGWIRVIAIGFGFLMARLYLLVNKMNVYFSEIE